MNSFKFLLPKLYYKIYTITLSIRPDLISLTADIQLDFYSKLFK